MRTLFAGGLLALSFALMGCPSTTTLGMARTLDKGHLQLAVAPGIYGFVPLPGAPYEGPPGTVQLEVAGRYGLTDDVEMGLKLWLYGAQLESKLSLLRSRPDSGIDIALAPAGGAVFYSQGVGAPGQYNFHLPLLIGFNLDGSQLVLAPRLTDVVLVYPSRSNILLGGGSVGFAIKITPSLRLMPEISALRPMFGATTQTNASLLFQFGLGILFGGYQSAPPH